jgi:hypothetical protein
MQNFRERIWAAFVRMWRSAPDFYWHISTTIDIAIMTQLEWWTIMILYQSLAGKSI